MAFILKSTRLIYKGVGCTWQKKLTNLKNFNSLSRWEHFASVNAVFWKTYSTAPPQIMTNNILEKAMYQLDLDMRYKNRIFKRDIINILKSLEHWGNITYSQSLLLLGCCGSLSFLESHHERINMCFNIWKILERTGVKFDISHYNALLSVYIENEHVFSPEDFLDGLKSKNIEPNQVTYERLLRAYCLSGNVTSASTLLEKMKNDGFPLNEYIFNSLIYCHCQIGDIESAYAIMNLMSDRGIEPTSDTYHSLICGLAKNGHLEKVNSVLEECEEKEIPILDKDILELSYILASNGYVPEAYNVLKKVKKQYGYNKYASLLVYKLLQKNLDSLALDVFLTIEQRKGDNENRSVSKFLMDYYVSFRPVKDVIQVCEILKKKGFSTVPINYALRKFLIGEDIERCFELFSEMRKLGVPLRSHFFWPLIIRAKSGGNSAMHKVLDKMRNFSIPRCHYTSTKIVFENYAFGKNWVEDIECLKRHGVDDRLISWKLLLSFIQSNEMESAEQLARSRPIQNTPFLVPGYLAINLLENPTNLDSVVRILYWICHDAPNRMTIEKEMEEQSAGADWHSTGMDSGTNFIPDSFFRKLLETDSLPKEDFRPILEAFLRNKIPICSKTALLITKKYDDLEIHKLVNNLGKVEFIFDENIKSLKQPTPESSTVRKLALLQNIEAEELWKEQGCQLCFNDLMGLLILHSKLENVEKAMNYCRMLVKAKDLTPAVAFANCRSFRILLDLLSKNNETKYLEEAVDIGIETSLIKVGDYRPLINHYLKRGELSQAVDVFCEKTCKTNSIVGYGHVVHFLIAEKESELLKKLTNAIADIRGESKSLTLLLFEFMVKGLVKQAKKLIETNGFVVSEEVFIRHSRRLFEIKSTIGLETVLEVSKGMVGLNRMTIYEYLLSLYVSQKDMGKVEMLWLQAQADGVSLTEDFINKINAFMISMGRDPLVQTFQGTDRGIEERVSVLIEEEDYTQLKALMKENRISRAVKHYVVTSLAAAGREKEAYEIIREYQLHTSITSVCTALVERGNFEKYLDFIRCFIKDGPIAMTAACFVFDLLRRLPKETPRLFEGYKQVAFAAYEEKRCIEAICCYWALCILNDVNKVEANKIFDEYLYDCREPMIKKCIMGMRNDGLEFSEVLLSIPKYKAMNDIAVLCYTRLIKARANANDLNQAMITLERAVEDNLAGEIPKAVIQLLQGKVNNAGLSFPYEDLLKEGVIAAEST